MSSERVKFLETYSDTLDRLVYSLPVHSNAGQFDYEPSELKLADDWRAVDAVGDPFKIKVISPSCRMFVKVFSPDSYEYAQSYFQAYEELLKLDLNVPILMPLGNIMIKDCSLGVFPLGESAGIIRFNQIASNSDFERFRRIVSNYGLRSLGLGD